MAATPTARPAPAPSPIPGPRGLPGIGVGADLVKDPLTFLTRTVRHFGEVARLDLGKTQMILAVHPDAVRHVTQEHARNYEKPYENLADLLGNGLVSSNGAFWLRQRRLMQPAFHHQRIAALAEMMVAETSRQIEGWAAAARASRPISVKAEMVSLTQSIILNAMFSLKARDEAQRIGRAFTGIIDFVGVRQFSALKLPMSWPTPAHRRYRTDIAFLDRTVYGIIEERRRSGGGRGDLLDMLLEAEDAETGERMSPKQVRDEVMTIFLAGHETSATMLTWLLYLIAMHPHVERRVREELAALGGRAPAMADLPRLPALRATIDEALRLYPATWIVNRRALADDEIGGYPIPAGSIVALSPYVTQRLPAFWENPEAFDPERFMPGRQAARHKFAYVPFITGPRQCIGNSFALVEMQLALAVMLQRFQLRAIPGYEVRPEARALIRPASDVWMEVTAL